MKEFKIPKRSLTATLRLEDGSRIAGKLFVPREGADGRPGRLVDRLNDDNEHFLPIAEAEGSELVNKDCLVWARPEVAADASASGPPGSQDHRVRLVLRGGDAIDGTMSFLMPPERSRLLDYLNAAPRFVAVAGEETLLVNRRFIARIEDLSRDPD